MNNRAITWADRLTLALIAAIAAFIASVIGAIAHDAFVVSSLDTQARECRDWVLLYEHQYPTCDEVGMNAELTRDAYESVYVEFIRATGDN